MKNVESISTYAILATVYALILPAGSVARFIAHLSEKGNLPYYMVRPLSFFKINFFLEIGRFLANFVIVVIPLLIAYSYFFKIKLVFDNGQMLTEFLISSLLGYLLAFQFGYLIGLLSLKTNRIGGFVSLFEGFMIICGGSVLPISIYPRLLRLVVRFTPFYAVQYVPLSGLVNNTSSWFWIMVQLFWMMILIPITSIVFKLCLEKVDLAGG